MFPVVGHFDRPLQSAPTMFQPFLRPCSILWRFYVGAENSKIPIPKIRYHPFGIGIGTDIAFGISVPESTAGSTEIPKYRISFGIPSSDRFVSQRATRSFFSRISSSIRGEAARGSYPPPHLCRGRMRNGLGRRGLRWDSPCNSLQRCPNIVIYELILDRSM